MNKLNQSSSSRRIRLLFTANIVILSAISVYLLYDISRGERLPVDVHIDTVQLSKYDGYIDTPTSEAVSRPDVFEDTGDPVSREGTVTREWLNANLYKVSSYHENDDGTFDVQLLEVTGPNVDNWDELVEVFENTPYSDVNTLSLDEGVNCQGMVLYLANWCDVHDYIYEIRYQPRHISIVIIHRGAKYLFSFSEHPLYTMLEND